MPLTPLTDKNEIRKAYKTYESRLTTGGETWEASLGFQGGQIRDEVTWFPSLNQPIWTAFWPDLTRNRYWCAYGVQYPQDRSSLDITCEINIPKQRIDRRIAGVFARDETGAIYLTHSGRIGGSRQGISKSAFWEFFAGRAQVVELSWPDGWTTESFLIGNIDSPRIKSQIAHFVHEVQRFKEQIASGQSGSPPATSYKHTASFSPEFSGQRKSYTQSQIITARCDHGSVVNALRSQLEKTGSKAGNDRNRDLFLVNRSGRMTALFEAKTDLAPSSVYSAIGQLLFHSTGQKKPPILVFAAPGKPQKQTADVLKNLGIKVLEYRIKGDEISFKNLAEVMKPGT